MYKRGCANGKRTQSNMVSVASHLLYYSYYCIVQNSGRGKHDRIGSFKNLVRKTMTNCNELFLSSLIKISQSHIALKLNTTIIYFIIRCSVKMVCAFAMLGMVRGHHEYKDVWNVPSDGT